MQDGLIAPTSYGRSCSALALHSKRGEDDHIRPSLRRRDSSQPSPSSHPSFDELRRRVEQALASLGYPSLTAVNCEVDSDRVVLSGALPSYHLKQLAQVAALRVAGANRVDNLVVVTSF